MDNLSFNPFPPPGAPISPPSSVSSSSALLDQAYKEYCHLCSEQAGDPDAFCARYPSIQSSLGRLLDAHLFLQKNPELLGATFPEPGQTFSDFHLYAELGRGGFGRVYLAKEAAMGDRWVVIKVSTLGMDEARTQGRISHPNVVLVHSIKTVPSSRFSVVCMPYLGSATLSQIIDRVRFKKNCQGKAQEILKTLEDPWADLIRPTPEDSAPIFRTGSFVSGLCEIAAQIADALACIHAREVTHRDLKPSNVLMRPNGTPMLIDFNLADDARHKTALFGGTLLYMSPEQLQGFGIDGKERVSLDYRSDIYSFGIILHELFSGSHPFPCPADMAAKDRKTLLQRQQAEVRLDRVFDAGRLKPVGDLIRDCLRVDPKHRPQTASEIASRLRTVISAPAKKRKRVFAATMALSLAGLFTMWIYSFAFPPPSDLERGLQALQKDKYAEAIQPLSKALESDSSVANAWFARGFAHMKLGKFQTENFGMSITDLATGDQIAPNPKWKACLAYSYFKAGQFDMARLCYKEAYGYGYRDPRFLNNFGAMLLDKNQRHEAEAILNEAVNADPTLRVAYLNRAINYLRLAMWASALTPVEIQKQQLKDFKPLEKKRYYIDLAHQDFQKIIERDPAFGEIYLWAAVLGEYASRDDASWIPKTLGFLDQALQHGANPQSLPNWKRFDQESKYHEMKNRSRINEDRWHFPREIEPVERFQ